MYFLLIKCCIDILLLRQHLETSLWIRTILRFYKSWGKQDLLLGNNENPMSLARGFELQKRFLQQRSSDSLFNAHSRHIAPPSVIRHKGNCIVLFCRTLFCLVTESRDCDCASDIR